MSPPHPLSPPARLATLLYFLNSNSFDKNIYPINLYSFLFRTVKGDVRPFPLTDLYIPKPKTAVSRYKSKKFEGYCCLVRKLLTQVKNNYFVNHFELRRCRPKLKKKI